MKVRIYNNSIRIRVGKEELDTLALKGSVSMDTRLPNAILTTNITSGPGIAHVRFTDNNLIVGLPKDKIYALRKSDEEGFKEEVEIEGDDSLAILFQKDYVCIGREEQLNQGLFPNPKIENGTC